MENTANGKQNKIYRTFENTGKTKMKKKGLWAILGIVIAGITALFVHKSNRNR